MENKTIKREYAENFLARLIMPVTRKNSELMHTVYEEYRRMTRRKKSSSSENPVSDK
jgi:hypothetical protein